jgi:hypothetical protein
MKKINLIIFLLVFSGLIAGCKKKKKQDRRRSFISHLMQTDLNGDGKKDLVVVYSSYKNKMLMEGISHSGKQLWETSTEYVRGLENIGYAVKKMSLETKNLFILFHQKHYGIDKPIQLWLTGHNKKDGEKIWSYSLPKGEGKSLYAHLYIHKNKIYFFSRFEGKKTISYLYSLSSETGKLIYKKNLKSMRHPNAPQFTDEYMIVRGVGFFQRIWLKSGKTELFRGGGMGYFKKDTYFFFSYEKNNYILKKLEKNSKYPVIVKTDEKPVFLAQKASPYTDFALKDDLLFCFFGGKGVQKTRLSIISTSGTTPTKNITMPDGHGFSNGFTRWKNVAPQYSVFYQISTRFFPIILMKKIPKNKKPYSVLLAIFDTKTQEISWKSKPVIMFGTDLFNNHIFVKNKKFYIHIPYMNKKRRHRALMVMDGNSGKIEFAFLIKTRWENKWYEKDLRGVPCLINKDEITTFSSNYIWRINLKTGKLTYQNHPNIGIKNVLKEVEKTWGKFPK